MSYYEKWSDASKRKRREYDNTYYSVLGCKLPRPIADAFRRHCANHGITVSAALAAYIRDTLSAASDPAGETDPAGDAPSR